MGPASPGHVLLPGPSEHGHALEGSGLEALKKIERLKRAPAEESEVQRKKREVQLLVEADYALQVKKPSIVHQVDN